MTYSGANLKEMSTVTNATDDITVTAKDEAKYKLKDNTQDKVTLTCGPNAVLGLTVPQEVQAVEKVRFMEQNLLPNTQVATESSPVVLFT